MTFKKQGRAVNTKLEYWQELELIFYRYQPFIMAHISATYARFSMGSSILLTAHPYMKGIFSTMHL